ncbi:MAG TPA: DUF4010 domain-containing protein, partial [Actinomycetospora sp.]|uniref:DUF4010 domain-containing protein n=1 Tax=Actinomycetospora sp. TaxID=1872135 RepID=UPI002F41F087
LERERSGRETRPKLTAGARTFALIALVGAVAAALGTAALVVALAAVVVFVVVGYVVAARTTTDPDLGTTTEVAALGTFLLGALAWAQPAWAVPLGVGLLVVLAVKRPLHRFATNLVTDQDVTDALRLFVVALVVLPLLPDRPLGPGGVLNPARIWLLVVVLTVIGWAGYVAVRALGERVGLLVVGFLGGFVSASATTVVLARRRHAASGTVVLPAVLAASVATLVQLVTVVAVASPTVAVRLVPAAAAGVLVLVAEIAWLVRAGRRASPSGPAPDEGATDDAPPSEPEAGPMTRPLSLTATLTLAVVLVVLLLLSHTAAALAGGGGVMLVALVGGLADAHASAVAAATLAPAVIPVGAAVTAVGLALASNTVAKLVLATAAGGRVFAVRLALLLLAPAAAVTVALVLVR